MFVLPVDDQITLVLAEERHARVVTDLIVRNQRRLARWEPWAEQPQPRGDARLHSARASKTSCAGRQVSTIIALDRRSRLVGRCGLRINPYAGSADVGYWIDGDYEGRGIVRRATHALVSMAFAELELSRRSNCAPAWTTRAVADWPSGSGSSSKGRCRGRCASFRRSDDVAMYCVTGADWPRIAD